MKKTNKLTFILSFLTTTSIALSGTISENQQKWYKSYKKQKNAPDPKTMVINTDKEPSLSDGFTDLYNKKDLSGWKNKGGKHKFEAKGDVLVGTCVPGLNSGYLSTEKNDYKNFIFSCEIKWLVDGNTGVMFRAKTKPGKKGKETVFGPQAEMEGFEKKRGWSGGIYGQDCGGYFYPLWLDAHKEARASLKKDDWNRITIKAVNDHVLTWVNGIPAANWSGNDTFLEGFFSLQIHKGEAGTIHFKNIKVKEL